MWVTRIGMKFYSLAPKPSHHPISPSPRPTVAPIEHSNNNGISSSINGIGIKFIEEIGIIVAGIVLCVCCMVVLFVCRIHRKQKQNRDENVRIENKRYKRKNDESFNLMLQNLKHHIESESTVEGQNYKHEE